MAALIPAATRPRQRNEAPLAPPPPSNDMNGLVYTTELGGLSPQFPPDFLQCDGCLEPVTDRNYAEMSNCAHRYCRDCSDRMIKISLESKPFGPLRCCGIIPIEDFHSLALISPDQRKKYEKLMEEVTLPIPKLYCWDKDCNEYIPSANRNRRVGRCDACEKKTCKACRQKSHFGPCDPAVVKQSQDETSQIMQLGATKKWKLCPNCQQMIQKSGGCQHIICKCEQHFCFVCGQPWHPSGHHCDRATGL
ncbi:hypothetical protein F5Y17DRAFT_411060 [Xylariaceae sp. FL0594]|nr:hypothetical protein F5Y17DRAFT_411060 [Xylariaceae sp. FL0594]